MTFKIGKKDDVFLQAVNLRLHEKKWSIQIKILNDDKGEDKETHEVFVCVLMGKDERKFLCGSQ